MRSSSIVLLSGGLDSALAFLSAFHESDIVFAVTFDYGQRAAKAEIKAAKLICRHYDVAHRVVEVPFFSELTGHAFFDATVPLPQLTQSDLDDSQATHRSASAVWVPNRNGIFLSIAAALAEIAIAQKLYVGFNAEEARTFPDNSRDFIEASNKALYYSTKNHVRVTAPTVSMHKNEIAKQLIAQKFPIDLIWSCYNSGNLPCGDCESCQRLTRALSANGIQTKSE